MGRVGGGDDDLIQRITKRQGLSGKDNITIQGVRVGGLAALTAGIGPQSGRLAHDSRRKWQVTQGLGKNIKVCQPVCFAGADQRAAQFVIRYLWDNNLDAVN